MEDDAWTVVTELERLRPGIGAALSSPRYESVHRMRLTLRATHREAAGQDGGRRLDGRDGAGAAAPRHRRGAQLTALRVGAPDATDPASDPPGGGGPGWRTTPGRS